MACDSSMDLAAAKRLSAVSGYRIVRSSYLNTAHFPVHQSLTASNGSAEWAKYLADSCQPKCSRGVSLPGFRGSVAAVPDGLCHHWVVGGIDTLRYAGRVEVGDGRAGLLHAGDGPAHGWNCCQ